MASPLDDYRRKRDFARTPEPGDQMPPVDGGRRFVVHRHEARNLHYDLRLQVDNVLCSFAVPRGFSYDPDDKRLAVRTEDHPLRYEDFSGTIPRGEYGGGTMVIWDRGDYELVKITDWPTAWQQGEIKVVLRGRHLRGEWHLVRTQQGPNTWLLFKSKDRYAGPARETALGVDLAAANLRADAEPFEPMRCGGERAPFVESNWLFELEFIGQRTQLALADGAAALADVATAPPLLADALKLRAGAALLDGVLVAMRDGRPDAAALAAELQGDGAGLLFYAFDLLAWEEFDLRPLPLLQRKLALRNLLPDTGRILYVDHVAGAGDAMATAVAGMGLPGAIAKRAASTYRAGPQPDWLRVPVTPGTAVTAAPATRSRVKFTNLDKVYWPAEGFTKGQLIAYYEQIAEFLLPHLHDRPVHLQRFPDGIEGKSFYQREAKPGTPDWLPTAPVPHDGEIVPHHLIQDRDCLRYVIQLGSIDLHPWLSRIAHPDQPDYAVLDLDPKSAPFENVVRIARAAGRLLRGLGLRPLLKTSGNKGLHVFVPLQPGYSYEHSKTFTEIIARMLVRELADIATIERVPEKRQGKVYLDFLQNRRSQTIVPPYSARPAPGATVSAPLHWDELDQGVHPGLFTIQTMPARVQQLGDLFEPALRDGQDLLAALAKLEQQK